jgi:hypothetical protein
MTKANGTVFIPSTQSPDQSLFEEVQSRMYAEPAKWLVILEGLVAVCRERIGNLTHCPTGHVR